MANIEDSSIDYAKLIDDAMHQIVKNALGIISEKGFTGDQHFFISFNTLHKDVSLSKNLLSKYPSEMTIVLQHQFESLKVFDSKFEVELSFDDIKEKIVIPFESLVAFADPSVKFGLHFKRFDDLIDDDSDNNEYFMDNIYLDPPSIPEDEKKQEVKVTKEDNVVTVDFTKK